VYKLELDSEKEPDVGDAPREMYLIAVELDKSPETCVTPSSPYNLKLEFDVLVLDGFL
jgi:hypothetical protein